METKIVRLLNAYIDLGALNVFNNIKNATLTSMMDTSVGKRHITGKTFLKDFNNSIDGTGEIEYPRIELIKDSKDLDAMVIDYTKGNFEIVLLVANDLNLTGKVKEFPNANALTDCYILYEKDINGESDKSKPIIKCHILVGMKSAGIDNDNMYNIIKHELCHSTLWYIGANNPDYIKKLLSEFDDNSDTIENEFLCDFMPYYPPLSSCNAKSIMNSIETFREIMPKLNRPHDIEYKEFLNELEEYYRNLPNEMYDEYMQELDMELDDDDYDDDYEYEDD